MSTQAACTQPISGSERRRRRRRRSRSRRCGRQLMSRKKGTRPCTPTCIRPALNGFPRTPCCPFPGSQGAFGERGGAVTKRELVDALDRLRKREKEGTSSVWVGVEGRGGREGGREGEKIRERKRKHPSFSQPPNPLPPSVLCPPSLTAGVKLDDEKKELKRLIRHQ
jgi:hypothetical protein